MSINRSRCYVCDKGVTYTRCMAAGKVKRAPRAARVA
jgi:hypothetical protein